jgi:hypothetical protein
VAVTKKDDYTAFSLLRDGLMQFEGPMVIMSATRRVNNNSNYGMKDGGRIGYGFGSLVKAF